MFNLIAFGYCILQRDGLLSQIIFNPKLTEYDTIALFPDNIW